MRSSRMLLSVVFCVFVLPAAAIAQAGPWGPGPELNSVRYAFPLVELPSGDFLAAGGVVPGTLYTATAEILAGDATAWTPVSSMPSAHRGKDLGVLLLSGEVLIAGEDPHVGGHPHPRFAYRYDEASDTWTRTANDPTIDRFSATLTLLPDGRVLFAGGYSGHGAGPTYATAEIYDPITDAWTATGTMAEVRVGHTATLLTTGPNAGQVLVVGGSDRAPNNIATTGCELYDPASGTWSPTGSLSESRSSHTATLLPSGKVLVTGGQRVLNAVNRSSAEIYDPQSGTWSLAASMSEPRNRHIATLLRTGKVLVAGGAASGDLEAVSSAEIYDPLADSWAPAGSMATPRRAQSAVLLRDGRVLVAGGTSGSTIFSSSEIFDFCYAAGDADGDGVCDDEDVCPGFDDLLDGDGDTVPDGCDLCPGADDLLDGDGDGVPDGCDLCPGFDDFLDADRDGVPDGCDLCPGFDDFLDADRDGVPDGCDLCQGDDGSGDVDGDGFCADSDCDDGNPSAVIVDGCGVCGGDDSSCGIFEDGFESGDVSAWSSVGS
jgi:Galactose oxidase, central domain